MSRSTAIEFSNIAEPFNRAVVPVVFLDMKMDATAALEAWSELWLATMDPEEPARGDRRHLPAYRERFEKLAAYEAALEENFQASVHRAELNTMRAFHDLAQLPQIPLVPFPAAIALPPPPFWEQPRDNVRLSTRRANGPLDVETKTRALITRRKNAAIAAAQLAKENRAARKAAALKKAKP